MEAIQLDPKNAYYRYAVAMCDWATGSVDSAGEYLQDAVRLNPKLGPAQAWLGEWYMLAGITEAALPATANAVALEPDNPAFILSRAWVLEAAGDLDGAWQLVQKLLARGQMTPSAARLYGQLASRYGQQAQALALIDKLMAAGLPPSESRLHFTAAQLLDNAGRYDEAFAHAIKGNAVHQGNAYDPTADQRCVEQLINYFTRQRMASLPQATVRSDKPVFIVGMPRSGTSLVEQILASHPSVYGAGELDFIHRILMGTLGMLHANIADYPRCLDRLNSDHLDGMANVYLAPLLALKPEAARITDKMPLNFLHLGLIAALFPGARIIHCMRDPMDTCLSCFLTHFTQYPFTHDLTHLGTFYRQYQRLMAHWKSVIDLPMLDVCYEQLVTEPEGQSRRLVEFLGLPWDDRCLRFYQTQRPCITASAVQVRKPIYKTAMQRWRHYEKHLGPLKAALGIK